MLPQRGVPSSSEHNANTNRPTASACWKECEYRDETLLIGLTFMARLIYIEPASGRILCNIFAVSSPCAVPRVTGMR